MGDLTRKQNDSIVTGLTRGEVQKFIFGPPIEAMNVTPIYRHKNYIHASLEHMLAKEAEAVRASQRDWNNDSTS